jgi:5-methylcytosine-specific restriction protein B
MTLTFKGAVKSITSAHVKRALSQIDLGPIPRNRRSTKWCLKVGNARYPPKYVLSLAVANAIGRKLSPSDHRGGEGTNKILRSLGFEIISCSGGSNVAED